MLTTPAAQIYNANVDANQDGRLTNQELNAYVLNAQMKELENTLMKRINRILVLLLSILFIALILLLYGIIEVTKEVKTSDGKMIDPATGDTLECASADFVITSGGVLAPANYRSTSTNTNQQTNGTELAPEIIDALAVRNYYKQVALHSSLPEKYFRELQWLNLESKTATTLSMQVSSVIRIPHNKAKCGSYLKLTTANGIIMFDDADIYYDHDIYNLFAESGYEQHIAVSSNRRILHHLSASHHKKEKRGFRHLAATEDLGFVGFFNTIDSYEWTCESVAKPVMPEYYSADLSYYIPCLDPTNSINENLCIITIDSTDDIPLPGIASKDNLLYHVTKKSTFVTPDVTYLVAFPPHHPGAKVVVEAHATGYFRSYQISHDGDLSYCYHNDVMSMSMNLPEEFIFYPVGNEGNLRRFKLTFQSELTSEYYTMEYYDDAETLLPKMMISPSSSIIFVDTMEVGMENMRTFESLDINITTFQFQTCSRKYQNFLKSKNDFPVETAVNSTTNFTDIGNTTSIIDANFTNTTSEYPPDASLPPIGMRANIISYYAQQLQIDNTTLPGDFSSSNVAAWVEWYLETFEPAIEDIGRRKLTEDKIITYQTSFLEFYMSGLDPHEVGRVSRSLYSRDFSDEIARNITILQILRPDSFAFQQDLTEEEIRRILITLCTTKMYGAIGFCASTTSLVVKVALEVVPFEFELSVEVSREVETTTTWTTIVKGEASGCFLGVFCGRGSITTTKGKVAGCLTFALDLGGLPAVSFLATVFDLSWDIFSICYTKSAQVPEAGKYDSTWWPQHQVVHKNVHSIFMNFSYYVTYIKVESFAGVQLYTSNDMCTPGKTYNGKKVPTGKCISDPYYNGGGLGILGVTVYYYDSIIPLFGDWEPLWTKNFLDKKWLGWS